MALFTHITRLNYSSATRLLRAQLIFIDPHRSYLVKVLALRLRRAAMSTITLDVSSVFPLILIHCRGPTSNCIEISKSQLDFHPNPYSSQAFYFNPVLENVFFFEVNFITYLKWMNWSCTSGEELPVGWCTHVVSIQAWGQHIRTV